MKAARKKINIRRALCLALALALVCCLWGCQAETAGNLMTGITGKRPATEESLTEENADAAADFGLRLLRDCLGQTEQENAMLSPLSILCALSMTANGAKGETLSQMEQAFGLPQDALREYLAAYVESLKSTEDVSFHAANSLWLKDQGLSVERSFLQANADYFGADAYMVPMNNGALEKINNWVKENTRDMIPKILEELAPKTVAVLVNALAFEGKWEEPYESDQVWERTFTREDGAEQTVDMMFSQEFSYLEDGAAKGFLKYYKGREYAFAALLPGEGVSVREYLDSLTGEKLRAVLENAQGTKVNIQLPKFTSDYSASLENLLPDMGMTDLFDPGLADLSGLGTLESGENIYVSQVLHKTHITVDEQGTKAAAATAVVAEAGCAEMEEPKSVVLDRPFVYAVIDCKTNTPIFLGALLTM